MTSKIIEESIENVGNPNDRVVKRSASKNSLFDSVSNKSYQLSLKEGDKEFKQQISVLENLDKINDFSGTPYINVKDGNDSIITIGKSIDEKDQITIKKELLGEQAIAILGETFSASENGTYTLPVNSVKRTDGEKITIDVSIDGKNLKINIDGKNIYVTNQTTKPDEEKIVYKTFKPSDKKTLSFDFSTTYENLLLNGNDATYKYTNINGQSFSGNEEIIQKFDPRELLCLVKNGVKEGDSFTYMGPPNLLYTELNDNNNENQKVLLVNYGKNQPAYVYVSGGGKKTNFMPIDHVSLVSQESNNRGIKTKDTVNLGLIFSTTSLTNYQLICECDLSNDDKNTNSVKAISEFMKDHLQTEASGANKFTLKNGINILSNGPEKTKGFISTTHFKERSTEEEKEKNIPQEPAHEDAEIGITPTEIEATTEPTSEESETEVAPEEPAIIDMTEISRPDEIISGSADDPENDKPDKPDSNKPDKPSGNGSKSSIWDLIGKFALLAGIILFVGCMFGLGAAPIMAVAGIGLVFAGTAICSAAEHVNSDTVQLDKAQVKAEKAMKEAEETASKVKTLEKNKEIIDEYRYCKDFEDDAELENLKRKYNIKVKDIDKYINSLSKKNTKLESQVLKNIDHFSEAQLKRFSEKLDDKDKTKFLASHENEGKIKPEKLKIICPESEAEKPDEQTVTPPPAENIEEVKEENNPNAEEAENDAEAEAEAIFNILPEKEKPDVDKVTEMFDDLTKKQENFDELNNPEGTTEPIVEIIKVDITGETAISNDLEDNLENINNKEEEIIKN